MHSNSIPSANREAPGLIERLRSVLPSPVRYPLQAPAMVKQRACHRQSIWPSTVRKGPSSRPCGRGAKVHESCNRHGRRRGEAPAPSTSDPGPPQPSRRSQGGPTPHEYGGPAHGRSARAAVVADVRRRTRTRLLDAHRREASANIRSCGSDSVTCRPGSTPHPAGHPARRMPPCAPDRCANDCAFSCGRAPGHMIQRKESGHHRRGSRRGRAAWRAVCGTVPDLTLAERAGFEPAEGY